MSLYDLIMGEGEKVTNGYTRSDWEALGRGELDDEMVEAMLAEGYENMIGDD